MAAAAEDLGPRTAGVLDEVWQASLYRSDDSLVFRHPALQAKAGHSQSTITDRYIPAAQVLFPGAAEKAEARMFGTAG